MDDDMNNPFSDGLESPRSNKDFKSPSSRSSRTKSRRARGDDNTQAFDALGSQIKEGLVSMGRSFASNASAVPSAEINQLREIALSTNKLIEQGQDQTAQILSTQQTIVQLLAKLCEK
jgi:hypothetical protein